MKRIAEKAEKQRGGAESLDDNGRDARPEEFFGMDGFPVGGGEIGEQKRQKNEDEGIVVESFGDVGVEKGGDGAGGSAAGAIDVEIMKNGALRVEVVLLGREETQEGCADEERGGG
jgi:hypothetical protein